MDCRSEQLDASAGAPSHKTERLRRAHRELRGRAIRGNARVVISEDNPGPFEPLVSSGNRFTERADQPDVGTARYASREPCPLYLSAALRARVDRVAYARE